MAETTGSGRACARVEPGPTAENGRVRPTFYWEPNHLFPHIAQTRTDRSLARSSGKGSRPTWAGPEDKVSIVLGLGFIEVSMAFRTHSARACAKPALDPKKWKSGGFNSRMSADPTRINPRRRCRARFFMSSPARSVVILLRPLLERSLVSRRAR
jgi:hypothetical protein